jgi:hypothetical protein
MAVPHKTVNSLARVTDRRQSRPFAPLPLPQTGRAGGRIAARAVGTFVPKITRTALDKFGFATAELLTEWANIVGPSLAEATRPDRIKWPKSNGHGSSQDGEPSGGGRRAGATLQLRVDPARALDVQYKTALIIDRINSYFGYRAVADLRIIQSPIAGNRPQQVPAPTTPSTATADPAVDGIADDGLRAALERMRQGMLGRRR